MAESYYLVSESYLAKLDAALLWQQNFKASGDGVTFLKTPNSASISVSQKKPVARRDSRGPVSFWAKITDFELITDNKWKYAWEEWQRTSSGWAEVTDGRFGTTEERFALNGAEASNDGAGVEGHGVDVDGADYPAGFAVQPIRGGPIRRIWVEADSDGNPTYTFEATNADDGTCEAE